MKNHAAPARPMHSIQKSVDVQIQQATIACATNETTTQLMIDKRMLWSELPTNHHLNNRGESLVAVQWDLSSNYQVLRFTKYKWKVFLMDAKQPEGPIPVFRRVRIVEVSDEGCLQCSCCLFQRHGYGCRHILSVIKTEVPQYRGFEVEDVSVHWWVIYYHFGERPQLNFELATMLRRLHKNDIKGPLLPGYQLILDLWSPQQGEGEVQPHFIVKPCNETVANYSTHDVKAATKWFSRSTVGLNLSQISVNYPSDVDASYCGFDDFDDSDDSHGKASVGIAADSDVAEAISFPTAAEATTSYKESNAFQAVGPLMKEYLGLLELAERKESKIKSLVSVMSDLINSEKKDQLQKEGVNNNKRQAYVSCLVPHDKRKKVEVTLKGRKHTKFINPYKKNK
jgi:hypothetical protein